MASDQLLAAALQGDREAHDKLLAHARPYIRSVADKMVHHHRVGVTDASDIAQQALAAASRHLDQFRGQTTNQWFAWLLAILRNEVRRSLRRGGPLPSQDLSESVAADEETPSQQAVKREDVARLLLATEKLDPRSRRVIQLRGLERLSHKEVAGQLGCSEAAARQLWVRAIRALASHFELQRT